MSTDSVVEVSTARLQWMAGRSVVGLVMMSAIGCGGSSSDGSPGITGVWSLDGFGETQPLAMLPVDSGTELSVWFKEDGTFFTGNYNGLYGKYQAVDEMFSVNNTVATAALRPALEPQSMEFAGRVDKADRYRMANRLLTLSSLERGELVFSNRLPALARTSWVLDRIRDARGLGRGTTPTIQGVMHTLTFQAGTTVHVLNNCFTFNDLSYRLDNRNPTPGGGTGDLSGSKWDGSFQVTSPAVMPAGNACSVGDPAFDREFLDLLVSARTYAVVRGELVLRSAPDDPQRDLVFKPKTSS